MYSLIYIAPRTIVDIKPMPPHVAVKRRAALHPAAEPSM